MTMNKRHGPPRPADILLVEDNPGDVRLTEEAFQEGQIANTLHVVMDGIEALDFLHLRGEYEDVPCPDIILLDLNLPRKDGEEVLREINDDPDLSRIPVVILTSSEAQEDIVRSYELDANAYLTKPVDPEEFIDTVQSLQQFWLSVIQLPPSEGE
jgi:CheY-like chemotaxis protein